MRYYILCSLLALFCSSCISYGLRNETTNEEWDTKDTICAPDSIMLRFGIDGSGNLIYEFYIYCYDNEPFNRRIKLNSISVILEKNKKTLIPQTIERAYFSGDTIPVVYWTSKIDSLPFIWNNIVGKEKIVTFRIEYDIPAKSIRRFCVNYDIEIGNKRIIKNQVYYKRKWFIGLPH